MIKRRFNRIVKIFKPKNHVVMRGGSPSDPMYKHDAELNASELGGSVRKINK